MVVSWSSEGKRMCALRGGKWEKWEREIWWSDKKRRRVFEEVEGIGSIMWKPNSGKRG
jgi:hypothetical protein